MIVLLILSVTIALAAGSQPSNYNAFNKQQQQHNFHNSQQSQTGHYQNYQHQTHHNQFNQPKPQHQPQQQQNFYQPQAQFQPNRNFIPITQYKSDMSHDGSYQYSYSTGNGIKADESGYLKNIGVNKAQVVQGTYSYTSPEGIPIHVQYTADEYGFRASGNHLPTPPPIPEAIQKSLQLIARTQPAPATHQWQNQQNVGAWQPQQQQQIQQTHQQHNQWQPQAHQKWN